MKKPTLLLSLMLMIGSMYFPQAQPVSKTETTTFLALGDSYTIGESVAESERWPNQLAACLNGKGYRIEKPLIIAKTGWRTDQLAQAVEAAKLKNDFGLVSLLIGVNNQYQGRSAESYKPEFEQLLLRAIELAGGRKERVIVVSIPDYGYTPFGESKQETIRKGVDAFNAVNKEIAEQMGIRYYNITELTRLGLNQPEFVATDRLHPSGKMYALWSALISTDF
jgi:lysophospholipase L1-like esterase